MATHEFPGEIGFVDELPRTTVGKIRRRTLREREGSAREPPPGHLGSPLCLARGPESAADHGFVDVTSLAFGEADPLVERYDWSGTDPAPHEKRGVSWSDALVDPPARNAFDLVLEDVTALTLWVEEAAIDPDEPVTLLADSTRPATVTLVSSSGRAEVTVPVGESEQTVELS